MYPLKSQNVPLGVHVPQFGNPCSKALVKDEFVSIHWDKKLIQEGRYFTAFEHIAVLSSISMGQNR